MSRKKFISVTNQTQATMMKAQISILLIVIFSQAHFSSAAGDPVVQANFEKVITPHMNNPIPENIIKFIDALKDLNIFNQRTVNITIEAAKTSYSNVVDSINSILSEFVLNPITDTLEQIVAALIKIVDDPVKMLLEHLEIIQNTIKAYEVIIKEALSAKITAITDTLSNAVEGPVNMVTNSLVTTPTHPALLNMNYLQTENAFVYLVINMLIKIYGGGMLAEVVQSAQGPIVQILSSILKVVSKPTPAAR